MAENYSGIMVQSPSLFDQGSPLPTSLLQLQTSTTTPLAAEMTSATGMVLPDLASYDRLAHFPEDLYDLRPESHLVRFLKALLGESGVGMLRKRYLLAQFEQALESTHFYDLDRFYGALFGARRGLFGALPVDPMAGMATPDGWDQIADYDARFRERIIKLSKAITLGGTPMGMQALAEALTGVECDIYEMWQVLDTQGPSGTLRTYAQVTSTYGTYAAMKGLSWGRIAGTTFFGNLGMDARNEFVVRPKKVYDTSVPEQAVQRAEDLYGIQRVVETLKPAFSIASIDDRGLAVHSEAAIGSVSADSEFWEVITCVIPQEGLDDLYRMLFECYDPNSGIDQNGHVVPRPPFSSSQGCQWSCAGDVASVKSFTTELGNHEHQQNVNYDTVTYYDGTSIAYRPEYAVIDPREAMLAQSAGEGGIVSHPYSGERKVVTTHG